MRFSFSIISIILLLVSFAAQAEDTQWIMSNHIKGRIVAEEDKFGVELETENGWHTYYKDPGEAGIPTTFDWHNSKDMSDVKVTFPAPKDDVEYGIKTKTYEGNVFFPASAKFGVSPVADVKVEGAICKEICMAFSMDLVQKLPAEYAPAGQGTETKSYLFIIWVAFLAGLILNIMPCVLPVLSLKVLGVLRQSGVEKSRVRLNFAAASCGIIFSFLILAILAIIFRNAGMAVGWGLHFQSPIFVGILMVITLAFAASLLGAFHLRPPSWIAGSGENNTAAGNFFSGMLATLLGTSCTAPVVVTAIGFALSGSAGDILLIFTIMGIGMATPFILFAIRPDVASYLPKPGGWMIRVKHFMGVLLLATGAWLGFVMYEQLSPPPKVVEQSEQQWQVFDPAKINQYVEQGKTVFIDITAGWCLNCKLNKAAVIDTVELQQYFKDNNIVLVKGDMTKPNRMLLNYIRKYQRYGIPFNQVYGPNAKDGILLPTLLTKHEVIEALDKAGAK